MLVAYFNNEKSLLIIAFKSMVIYNFFINKCTHIIHITFQTHNIVTQKYFFVAICSGKKIHFCSPAIQNKHAIHCLFHQCLYFVDE